MSNSNHGNGIHMLDQTRLVLTRKTHEIILIGDDIEIDVVEISRGKVRLGIKAPRDVSVDRKEIRAAREADRDAVQE